jgi:DNA-binding helix-hairpin-helix protein with protein kinase domain
MQTASKLRTVSGRTLDLGSLLGEGGEGSVYEVLNEPDLVLKRYHPNRIDPFRRRKVEAMIRMPAGAELRKHAAWPLDLVNGSTLAILMPKAKGYELHDLFGPKSRQIKFPQTNYKFLVEAAYNICAALDSLHKACVVVGDFNHKNVLVDNERSVRFLDCDSYQIRTGNEVFRCTVGVPDYLAPELHGKDFEKVLRSQNEDNFALGVLIFQLLFMGRHPYAGIGGPDLELGESIRRHLFAYGENAERIVIRPPPAVPSVRSISPALLSLFERAFSPRSVNGTSTRPGPCEWAKELKLFRNRLVQCQVNRSHEFYEPLGQGKCPWCALYSAQGVIFFYTTSPDNFNVEGGTLETILSQIKKLRPTSLNRSALSLQVSKPTASTLALNLQVPKPTASAPPPKVVGLGIATWCATIGFAVAVILLTVNSVGWAAVVLVCSAIALAIEPQRQRKREYRQRKREYEQRVREDEQRGREYEQRVREYRDRLGSELRLATEKVSQTETKLNEVRSRCCREFEQKKASFDEYFNEYKNLPTKRRLALEELKQKDKQLQLEEWLDSNLISDHEIPNFGTERKRRLAHYGVETALDVRYSLEIPGIGPVLFDHLLDWRRRMELQFVYDPKRPPNPKKVQEIDDALARRKLEIEKTFKSAQTHFNAINQSTGVAFRSAESQLGHALRLQAQARANYEAFTLHTR